MVENQRWQSRAGKLFCLAIALAAIYLILEYAIGVILPFFFAILIGSIISSVAKVSAKRFGGRRKAWAIFYTVVFWTVIFISIYLIVQKLVMEAGELMDMLVYREEEIALSVENAVNFIMALPSKIPFLKGLDRAGEVASDIAQGILKGFGEYLTRALTNTVLSTPKAILSLAVCIIAGSYIAVDGEKIKSYLLGLVALSSQKKAVRLIGRISKGIKGYGKAYFFLFLINFVQLYGGLLILRRKYALLVSFAIAILDILPLFSAGVFLIPWGIWLIVGGNYLVGVGMLLLFGIISVVRQIAEPRLIGKQLGIHPLATLVAMYIGLGFFGFWGMLLAPIGILMVKEILEGSKKEEKIGEKT